MITLVSSQKSLNPNISAPSVSNNLEQLEFKLEKNIGI